MPPTMPMVQMATKKPNSAKTHILRNVKFFYWEGAFSGLAAGCVDVYAVAYILYLGATPFQIALLVSLPTLLGSVIQLKIPGLISKWGTRKGFVRWGLFAFALLSCLMAFAFLFGKGWGVYFLIFGFCLYEILNQTFLTAWTSWTGDVVSHSRRGEFFAHRTRFNHIAMFLTTLAGGFFLSKLVKMGITPATGFCTLYLLGGLFRLFGFWIIQKPAEPPITHDVGPTEKALVSFFKNIRHPTLGWFLLYGGIVNLVIYMGATYLAPYFLQDLKINYTIYSILFCSLILGKFAFYPLWGRRADKEGGKKILILCGLLFATYPFFWLFSHAIFYLVLVQIYRAIFWSGYETASYKFLLDATTSRNRPLFASYTNLFNGILAVGGAMLGTFFFKHSFFASPYLFVFFMAGGIQLLVSVILLPLIREPQRTSSTSVRMAAPIAGAEVSPGESIPKA